MIVKGVPRVTVAGALMALLLSVSVLDAQNNEKEIFGGKDWKSDGLVAKIYPLPEGTESLPDLTKIPPLGASAPLFQSSTFAIQFQEAHEIPPKRTYRALLRGHLDQALLR